MARISAFKRDLARFVQAYFVYLMPSAFIVYLVLESYQIDFRPYYIAGKAILYGLDPYLNHVNQFPEFYTPVNASAAPWSGFIYPPFAAFLFVPFAMLPYVNAKVVYSVVILILLWLLFFELVRNLGLIKSDLKSDSGDPNSGNSKIGGEALLFAITSFPVLASFERGQIDILVCYIVVLGFFLHQRYRQQVLPGFLFAIAFCIKLFPGIAILYYLLKREFKVVAWSIGFIGALLLVPLPYFGTTVYHNYVKRILPDFFGRITSAVPISTHGQEVVNRVVMSIDSKGLRVTHDFVHGYMNPFLRSPIASLTVGAIAFLVLMYYLRRAPLEHQFFSVVNSILLFNPQTWIMGLVWFIPLFVYFFGKANHLGKFILILPLFMPPFTNSNGMLAYAITLAFAIPTSRARLLRSTESQFMATE